MQSKADCVSKFKIALKEFYETEYWLELMQKAELLPEETVKGICTTAVLSAEC